MPRLTANTSKVDQRRTNRLLIAWADGDREALDQVLAEVMRDPKGVPALIFALADFGSGLAEKVAPDFRDQLRQALFVIDDDGINS